MTLKEIIQQRKMNDISKPDGMKLFVASLVKQTVSEAIQGMEEEIATEIEKTIYEVIDQKITERFKGDKGDAYVLTHQDKQEIAKSINLNRYKVNE